MALPQEIARRAYQTPRVQVQVEGRNVSAVESVEIDLGYDQQTASAVVAARGAGTNLDFRQAVQVWLGYGAYLRIAFTGTVQDINRTSHPARYELRCVGALGPTLLQGPDDRSWSSTADTDLVGDLLERSGVAYDPGQIAGDALVLGSRVAVTLSEKQASTELLQRLDEAQGYRTFDLADGSVRRQLVLTLPSATGALTFVEGLNNPTAPTPTHYVLEVTNPQTIRGVHTKVVVTGLPDDQGLTPRAAYTGSSVYAPVEQVYESSSDLLETDDACATLAGRLLADQNRVVTQVTLRVAGNPYLQPGMTIMVTAPSAGITTSTPFFVVHVRHSLSAGDGFTSEVLLYGGASGAGYRTELRPVAAFTYSVTAETFSDAASGVGGTQTAFLTVVCDASASWDPDTPFEALTFAWSATGGEPATGTGVRFSFKAEPASFPIDVTLTVSDGTSEDVLTQSISATGAAVAARELFVAAGSAFLATPDGGATWNSQTGFNVRAVAPLLPTGEGWFGAGGTLYRTLDYCATAPESIRLFAGDVTAIWLHESISNRCLVGLDSGAVWLTTNLDQGTSATWVQLPHVFAAPVVALAESFDALGLIRVSSGNTVWISHDQLGGAVPLLTFAGTARAIALSFAGNYYSASDPTTPVMGEASTAFTFPATPADVRAITTHIRDQVVYAADRTGKTWIAAGGSAFVAGGLLGAGDPVNQLLRDGDHQSIIYAAADDGVYKTFDGALTWWLMRPLTGAGQVGHQLGYGGATLAAATTTVVETTTASKACDGLPPTGWGDADFDDAGYPAAVAQTSGQHFAVTDYGPNAGQVHATAGHAGGLRDRFTLPAGRIVGATLEVRAYNSLERVSVNGHRWSPPPKPYPPAMDSGLNSVIERVYTATFPASWFVPGAQNAIAVAFSNGSAYYDWEVPGYPPGNDSCMGAYYKLVING